MRTVAILVAAVCLLPACSTKQKDERKAEKTRKEYEREKETARREKEAALKNAKKDDKEKRRKMALEVLRRTATIGPPKMVKKKKPARIIAECAKGKGGVKALRAVKSVRVKQKLRGAASFETESFYVTPLTMRVDYYMAGKLAKSVITDGRKGSVLTGKGISKMEEAMVGDLRDSARADSISLLIKALKPGAKLTYLGETRVAGKKADAVKVEVEGLTVTVYIATDNHDFAAARRKTSRGMVTLLHADFREVSGLKLAHKTIIRLRSSVYVATVTEMAINPKFKPDVFDPRKHPLHK